MGMIKLHNKLIMIEPRVLCCRLTKKNKLRRSMLWLIEWKVFDRAIIFFILLSSLALAIFDYSDEWKQYNLVLTLSGWFFASIFLLESIFKIIARGFVNGPETYLRRSKWNVFDFVVVLSSIVDLTLLFFDVHGSLLRLLRMLRVLRPLRSLTTIPSLQM